MQRLAFASFCFLISASIKSTIARWENLPSLLYSSMCLSLSKERLNMRWFIFPSNLSISCAVILFESIVFSGNPLLLAVYHCSVRTFLDVLSAFESVFY